MADASSSPPDHHNPYVEEGPISPIERRNSLEKHLQHRPAPQDLKERHILLDTSAAPSLQAAQHDLARQKASDSLKKHLEKRPDREMLVERNILPSSNAAPALLARQKELDRSMRADSLEQKIQHRRPAEELVKEGILDEDEEPGKV
ncbi:hypothetical protein FQN54_003886 [Arachnomyces sp. PD_36]|nr:hypothetical protein FQN54_003886 [Arachnomyces sp. PD_36]